MEGRIWLISHNGSADLHTPIHPPGHTSRYQSVVYFNKMKILSYLAFLSFFVGKLSDGIRLKKFLYNMSQDGGLSQLKPADAEVRYQFKLAYEAAPS